MCVNFIMKWERQTMSGNEIMLVVWNSRWDADFYWVLFLRAIYESFTLAKCSHKTRSSDSFFRWSNYYAWYLLHVIEQHFLITLDDFFLLLYFVISRTDRAQLQVKNCMKGLRLNRKYKKKSLLGEVFVFAFCNCDKLEIVNVKHENLSQSDEMQMNKKSDFE